MLNSPTIQFIFIGTILWFLHSWLSPERGFQVSVSPEQIQVQKDRFLLRHDRLPTAQELRGEIRITIDEEAKIIEAIELGLHLSDPIIRRRLVQLIDLLDIDTLPKGTREDLERFYHHNKSNYQKAEQISFRHSFFGIDKLRAQNALEGNEDQGTAFSAGSQFLGQKKSDALKVFGAQFSNEIFANNNTRLVRSAYGWHLVSAINILPRMPLSFDEAIHKVQEDYLRDQKATMLKQKLMQRREKYPVQMPAILSETKQ